MERGVSSIVCMANWIAAANYIVQGIHAVILES